MPSVWLPLCVGALVINFWLTAQLLRQLEKHHGTIWESLGKPRLGDSNLSHQWISLLKWVWTLRFRSLSDSRLSRIAYSAMIGEFVAVASFIGLLVI